jgi:hypothetical protein
MLVLWTFFLLIFKDKTQKAQNINIFLRNRNCGLENKLGLSLLHSNFVQKKISQNFPNAKISLNPIKSLVIHSKKNHLKNLRVKFPQFQSKAKQTIHSSSTRIIFISNLSINLKKKILLNHFIVIFHNLIKS